MRDRCSEEQRVRARDRYGESARERRRGGIERMNERKVAREKTDGDGRCKGRNERQET